MGSVMGPRERTDCPARSLSGPTARWSHGKDNGLLAESRRCPSHLAQRFDDRAFPRLSNTLSQAGVRAAAEQQNRAAFFIGGRGWLRWPRRVECAPNIGDGWPEKVTTGFWGNDARIRFSGLPACGSDLFSGADIPAPSRTARSSRQPYRS